MWQRCNMGVGKGDSMRMVKKLYAVQAVYIIIVRVGKYPNISYVLGTEMCTVYDQAVPLHTVWYGVMQEMHESRISYRVILLGSGCG